MNKQKLLRPPSESSATLGQPPHTRPKHDRRGASLLRSPTEWLGTPFTMSTNASRSTLHVAITAFALVGIVTPFLPFTYDVSPLAAVAAVAYPHSDDFWLCLLGSPFFLAILVSIASIRLMVFGKSSRSELAVAYCVSIIMACATLFFTIRNISESWPSTLHDWFSLALPWAAIALGSALIVRSWLLRVPSGLIAVTTMQSAYVANALLCLFGFWPDWQIGAIVTLLTVSVYLGQSCCWCFRTRIVDSRLI
jgi:hypothetical protein